MRSVPPVPLYPAGVSFERVTWCAAVTVARLTFADGVWVGFVLEGVIMYRETI